MSQDDSLQRLDESTRFLDDQYDKAQDERLIQERRDAEFRARADERTSKAGANASTGPTEFRASRGALFDSILRDREQLVRDADDRYPGDDRWYRRIQRLNFSDSETCSAQLDAFCSEAGREASPLLPALLRLKWAFEEYVGDDNLRLIEPPS